MSGISLTCIKTKIVKVYLRLYIYFDLVDSDHMIWLVDLYLSRPIYMQSVPITTVIIEF